MKITQPEQKSARPSATPGDTLAPLSVCGLLCFCLSLSAFVGCHGFGPRPEQVYPVLTQDTPPIPPGAVPRTASDIAAPADTPHVFEVSPDFITWTPVSTQSGPMWFMRVVPLANAPPVVTNPPPSNVTLAWDAVGYVVSNYTLRMAGTNQLTALLVTTNTTGTFSNLTRGARYDFSVLALRGDGVASGYSSNVSYVVP